MATKIICIAGVAVVLIALMFLADRILPRKDNETDGDKE
jgi:hypothetical protein